MKESIIYQMSHVYRDDFRVRAFTFGEGEKALCIVGNMRGNEYQQIFLCSRVIQRLKKLEAEGRFVPGQQVMVIPSVNPNSMNINKHFWSIDNTDIDRMFPGYNLGETTQRIANGVFEVVNKYRSGVQFTSSYMPGEFQPHVRMMHTGFENVKKAEDFGSNQSYSNIIYPLSLGKAGGENHGIRCASCAAGSGAVHRRQLSASDVHHYSFIDHYDMELYAQRIHPFPARVTSMRNRTKAPHELF